MDYSVYIIYSKKLDSYYVGSTQDVIDRIKLHNKKSGSNFTKRANDWRMVYSESFDTRSQAQKREYQIKKKKSRKYIEWLINRS